MHHLFRKCVLYSIIYIILFVCVFLVIWPYYFEAMVNMYGFLRMNKQSARTYIFT